VPRGLSLQRKGREGEHRRTKLKLRREKKHTSNLGGKGPGKGLGDLKLGTPEWPSFGVEGKLTLFGAEKWDNREKKKRGGETVGDHHGYFLRERIEAATEDGCLKKRGGRKGNGEGGEQNTKTEEKKGVAQRTEEKMFPS